MAILKIHCFQHVPFEGPGYIEEWALSNGHRLTFTTFYEEPVLPDLAEIDWLIIMGGPMSVNDEDAYPWLKEEKQFIQAALDESKTVLGICLGSQLIASVLGANVYPNDKKEIGWFPVTVTAAARANALLQDLPETWMVFHWHGDTFDLPRNSIRLMESIACKNQAFLYGERVLGLQFHLEATPGSLEEMIQHGRSELIPDTYIQDPDMILSFAGRTTEGNAILKHLLDVFSR